MGGRGAKSGAKGKRKSSKAASQQSAGLTAWTSDTNTHTTYYDPNDIPIVTNAVTDGYRIQPSTGMAVPVGYYQTGDYVNINGELRDLADGKIKKLSPQTQKVVDAMDRNMRPLNNDLDTVRWTDTNAIASNLGMPGATSQQIINRLSGGDIAATKADYTSTSWDASANVFAGTGGRDVMINMHYAKGAMGQFSPTGLETEFVGARGVTQRFANARSERVYVTNPFTGGQWVDALVLDCYVQ